MKTLASLLTAALLTVGLASSASADVDLSRSCQFRHDRTAGCVWDGNHNPDGIVTKRSWFRNTDGSKMIISHYQAHAIIYWAV